MSASPIRPRPAASRSLRRVPESKPGIGILVVDDDPTIRTSLVALLQDEGYATLQAGDGEEALDILRNVRTPLVVLLDWMMPNLDGIALLHSVAADPVLPYQHAYIFTSAAFPAGLRQVAELPRFLRVDILVRPFNVDLMLAKIEHAAERLQRPHEDASRA